MDTLVLRPGPWNRFWQCPQTCSLAPVAGVEPTSPDGTSNGVVEAMGWLGLTLGRSSNCPVADAWNGVFGVGLSDGVPRPPVRPRFRAGGIRLGQHRLCLRCFGGNLPFAPIVQWG